MLKLNAWALPSRAPTLHAPSTPHARPHRQPAPTCSRCSPAFRYSPTWAALAWIPSSSTTRSTCAVQVQQRSMAEHGPAYRCSMARPSGSSAPVPRACMHAPHAAQAAQLRTSRQGQKGRERHTARPPAEQTGLPPKVLKCRRWASRAPISGVVTTAPSGKPLPAGQGCRAALMQ